MEGPFKGRRCRLLRYMHSGFERVARWESEDGIGAKKSIPILFTHKHLVNIPIHLSYQLKFVVRGHIGFRRISLVNKVTGTRTGKEL